MKDNTPPSLRAAIGCILVGASLVFALFHVRSQRFAAEDESARLRAHNAETIQAERHTAVLEAIERIPEQFIEARIAEHTRQLDEAAARATARHR